MAQSLRTLYVGTADLCHRLRGVAAGHFPLLGDVALLAVLYTVAAHQSRLRVLAAACLAEAGAVLAAVKWEPAGPPERSLLFLTATVVAALFAGLAVASGSRYLAWMDERAHGNPVPAGLHRAWTAGARAFRLTPR